MGHLTPESPYLTRMGSVRVSLILTRGSLLRSLLRFPPRMRKSPVALASRWQHSASGALQRDRTGEVRSGRVVGLISTGARCGVVGQASAACAAGKDTLLDVYFKSSRARANNDAEWALWQKPGRSTSCRCRL